MYYYDYYVQLESFPEQVIIGVIETLIEDLKQSSKGDKQQKESKKNKNNNNSNNNNNNNRSNQLKAFELLPKCLEIVSRMEKVVIEEEGIDTTGMNYRDDVINRICNTEWPTNIRESTLSLVSNFKDISMTQDILKEVVLKVIA